MAIDISVYTDPGVLVQEVVVPNALTINTVPMTVALVGIGSITKRATNEAVKRGGIIGETLSVSAGSPHDATLAQTSTQLQNDTTVYENGVPISPSLWSFQSSTVVRISDAEYTAGAIYTIDYVATTTDRDDLANSDVRRAVRVGSFAGVTTFAENIDYQLDDKARINSHVPDTYDLSVNNQLYLQIDGRTQIIITTAGASPATSTAAEVVADINAALIASGTYGLAYGTVADVYQGDQVRLTSPTQGATSELRINTGATNSATAIFGISTFPFIVKADVVDWSIDQAAELESSGAASPFDLSVNSVLEVAFDSKVDGAVKAEFTSLLAGPYVTTAPNNQFRVNIDGKGVIDITVTSGGATTAATIVADINAALTASGLYGATYATFASVVGGNRVRLQSPTTGASSSIEISVPAGGTFYLNVFEILAIQLPLKQKGDGSVECIISGAAQGAVTIAEVIADINARIADHSQYGSTFSTVAQNNGTNRLRLMSPTQGSGSKVRVQQAQTGSAHTTLLGLLTAQLPFTVSGTGTRPSVGTVYFITYEYVRPTTDYNKAVRHFNEDQLYGQVGVLENNPLNALAVAGQICFENDAPSIFTVQVRDSDGDGSYSVTDFQNAINTGLDNAAITEVVVLDTRLDVQTTLLNHTVNKSSVTEKKYRRAWYGVARNTAIGDIDTAGTLVYLAKRTFQVAPDSPGRGRLILAAPPNVSRTITKPDGTQPRLNLDSTYVAAAVAARHTSFTSVATSLLRKLITGFNTDDFQTYLDAERHVLAPAGVLVVTNDAGRLIMLDPISTEAGGGGLTAFSEISARAQVDNAVRAVTQAVDANLVGVVPEDLTDFIFDIKTVVATILIGLVQAGSIGNFKDSSGRTRDINLATDIMAFQSATDPTRFDFRFFFNLRYPAKRIFGEFSVDNPFFSLGEGAAISA